MQSRLHRPQRAADNRCDLVQLAPRRSAGRRPDDALPAISPPRDEFAGSLRTSPPNDRACTRYKAFGPSCLIQEVWRRTAVAVLSSIDGVKCRVANSRTPRGDHRSVPRIAMLRPASLSRGPGPVAILANRQCTATAHRVLFGQPLKCSCLARLGTIDQLSLGVFGCVHDIGDFPDPAKRFTCDKIFL